MVVRSLILFGIFSFASSANADIKCVINDFSNADKHSTLFIDTFTQTEPCEKQELLNKFNVLLSLKYCEWISFYDEEELVGFVVLDLKKYPELIHIRQGCIKMDKQYLLTSKRCFSHILERHKKCNTFHIITLKTNMLFQQMVLSLGFFPSEFLEDQYDPTTYMGFTFARKSSPLPK